MPTYKVQYKGDGKRYSLVIVADSEAACRRYMKALFVDMGFSKAEVKKIVVIDD